MFKLALYEIKKLVRDWRWLLIFLLQPITCIVFLGLVTYHEPENLRVSLYKQNNEYSNQLASDIRQEKSLTITDVSSEQAARDAANLDKVKAAVIIKVTKTTKISGNLEIIENQTTPEMGARAKEAILRATKDTLADYTLQNAKADLKSAAETQAESQQKSQLGNLNALKSQLAALPLSPTQNASLQQSLNSLNPAVSLDLTQTSLSTQSINVNETKNSRTDIKYFDLYASALIALLIYFIGLNTTSNLVTTERLEGTFERFFVTPYTKTHMLGGKLIASTLISLVLAIVSLLTLKIFFHVALGQTWLVLLLAFLTGLTASSLGILISAITKTIAESIQVSLLIFFSSLIVTPFLFQPETMHPAIKFFSDLIPFTYAIKAMREVNILHFTFTQVLPEIGILLGSMLFFTFLAVIFLHRKAD